MATSAHPKYAVIDDNFPQGWFEFLGNSFVTELSQADYVILTDNHVMDNIKTPRKIALLVEPTSIIPKPYQYVLQHHDEFQAILTYNKDVLALSNSFFCPYGGGWIQKEDWGLYTKTKNVSIVVSRKCFTDGHKLRHKVLQSFSNLITESFGFLNPFSDNCTPYKDFRFCVCIENTKQDYYFTEKVLDCFSTGTVPIYYGCPSLSKFFDPKGFLTFNTLTELNGILLRCNEALYQQMLPGVSENYTRMMNYWSYQKNIIRAIKDHDDLLNKLCS